MRLGLLLERCGCKRSMGKECKVLRGSSMRSLLQGGGLSSLV